jgi:hypothetical protein
MPLSETLRVSDASTGAKSRYSHPGVPYVKRICESSMVWQMDELHEKLITDDAFCEGDRVHLWASQRPQGEGNFQYLVPASNDRP